MSVPIALKCPNCGSALRTEDLDAAAGIIRCSYCRAVATMGGSPDAARGESAFRPRPNAPMPPGLAAEDCAGGIRITRRWFSAVVFFLIPFCVAWDSFLVFWYGMAFSGHAPWIMVVFPVAHVAVGVALTYSVIAMLLNRTVIIAGRGSIRISHGPVPWRGNMEINETDLDQFFCKMKNNRSGNGSGLSYEVWALLRSGAARKLLDTGLSQDQALFIEQRLERALGIKDRGVPGELAR